MKINITIKLLLSSLVFILISSGCSGNNKYNDFAKTYYSTYFEIIRDIKATDASEALKKMQIEENQNKINNLEVLLIENKDKVPKDKTQYYDKMNEFFEELKTLSDLSKSPWNELSIEQRIKADSTLISLYVDLKEWDNKNSTRVWW